jgi:hypothetical protein
MPEGELTLKQTFQMVSGTLKNGTNTTQISNGKLNGDHITFTAAGAQYSGRVSGNTMEESGNPGGSWKATRVGK